MCDTHTLRSLAIICERRSRQQLMAGSALRIDSMCQLREVAGWHCGECVVLGMMEHAGAQPCDQARSGTAGDVGVPVPATAMHQPDTRYRCQRVGSVERQGNTLECADAGFPDQPLHHHRHDQLGGDPVPLALRAMSPGLEMDCQRIARALQESTPEAMRGNVAFNIIIRQAIAMMAMVSDFNRVHRSAKQCAQHEHYCVIPTFAQAQGTMKCTVTHAQASHEHHRAGKNQQRPATHGSRNQGGRKRRQWHQQLDQDFPVRKGQQIPPFDLRVACIRHGRPCRGVGASRACVR